MSTGTTTSASRVGCQGNSSASVVTDNIEPIEPLMMRRNKFLKLPKPFQIWRDICTAHGIPGILRSDDTRYRKIRRKYENKLTELGIKFQSKLDPPIVGLKAKNPDYIEIYPKE